MILADANQMPTSPPAIPVPTRSGMILAIANDRPIRLGMFFADAIAVPICKLCANSIRIYVTLPLQV